MYPVGGTACRHLKLTSVHSTVEVTTQGYPGLYQNNRNDCWVIQTDAVTFTDERHIIKLSTVVMEAEYNHANRECVDFIEVFDGADHNANSSIAKWCHQASKPIFSTGRNLYIRFHSNDRNTLQGFHGIASVSVLAGRGPHWRRFLPCQSLYIPSTNITYTLASPGYPVQYANNINMCWVIYMEERMSVRMSHFIKLVVEDVETERDMYCAYDFLHARNGPNKCGDLIGEICGIDIPGPIISCKPTINLWFKTDYSETYSGWVLNFKAVSSTTHHCFMFYTDAGNIFGIVTGVVLLVLIFRTVVYLRKPQVKTYLRVKRKQSTVSICPEPGPDVMTYLRMKRKQSSVSICPEPGPEVLAYLRMKRKQSTVSICPEPGPEFMAYLRSKRKESVVSITSEPAPSSVRQLEDVVPEIPETPTVAHEDITNGADFDIDRHLEELERLERRLTLSINTKM